MLLLTPASHPTRFRWVVMTIYPTGTGAFACGSPDGTVLEDGMVLEIRLGGHWIAGWIDAPSHGLPSFVAQQDQMMTGLCGGMQVRLLAFDEDAGGTA